MPHKRIPRSQLSPEALAVERAKDRARYERNRDAILANDRKSYQKHAEKILARHMQYREANHDATTLAQRGYAKAYRTRHHARVLELERASRERNKASRALGRKRYLQSNAGRIKDHAAGARRRARKVNAPVNDFTAEQWEALCKAARYRCCYCRKKFKVEDLTPDHLTPYVKQGSNTLHNILPCCGPCNYRKKDRAVLKPVQPFLLVSYPGAEHLGLSLAYASRVPEYTTGAPATLRLLTEALPRTTRMRELITVHFRYKETMVAYHPYLAGDSPQGVPLVRRNILPC